MIQEQMKKQKGVTLLIIVAALGYFVDVFDLLLFGMVRISSLRDLGVVRSRLRKHRTKIRQSSNDRYVA
jgi:hypothetical protein